MKEQAAPGPMRVKKRSGALEPADLNKIVGAVTKHTDGLTCVDPMRVAVKTIGGLYDGATTAELDRLSIQTAAGLIADEPEYSKLAARLLTTYIDKEVDNQDIHSFSQSIAAANRLGLVSDDVQAFVAKNSRKLNAAVNKADPDLYEYFGLRTVYDRYLLRHPKDRFVLETPAYFLMRVACGLSDTAADAVEFFKLLSSHRYMSGTPTLFNSGTNRPQMSSCFLLDSPLDDLESIYNRYTDIAKLSKFAGGIGVAYHRVRSRGSLIKGTNGYSNGIVPWLKTLDSSVCAVNQGGKRKGACAVYLETWHADIEEFLELKNNTGDLARRTYNLNLVNWIPDEFMRRVEADKEWSLFDPKAVPELPDLWGEKFDEAYVKAEAAGLAVKKVPARELYGLMMKTAAETGSGWMTFKDQCNKCCNQTLEASHVVHSSNLCTEIIEVTSVSETAVCNIGSANLARHVTDKGFDYKMLADTVRTAIRLLDRTIDRNFYPTKEAEASNKKWRPVGLGVMGLQDVFFQLRLPFDDQEARLLSKKIQEEIYYHALSASCELAKELGAHPNFQQTRASLGHIQPDFWDGDLAKEPRWMELRERIAKHGLRNSLLIAIAPTATIASIVGAYECIEPQISNLFKRETLSGEFMQLNKYLVADLKALDLWDEPTRNRIKLDGGSVQNLPGLPPDLKLLYRTVWEIPMRSLIDMAADRSPYIDQSQSLNLFMAEPNIGKMSSMYMYAWKRKLKTTYYLRSRPATEIAKTTVSNISAPAAVACSLDKREACEVCQ